MAKIIRVWDGSAWQEVGTALPNALSTDGTQTLTNKTINLGNNTITGTTAQFNTALTDANFATLAGTETLTNKTINGSDNTITNIPNNSLTNSSITINGSAVSLGGSTTISGLPSQTSNSGKYLTTDGTTSSWANVTNLVPVDSNISVPGAPTSVSGTVLNASSSVSFVAPTNNGGSTILGYTVISSPDGIKKSGTSSPILITGLTNNTSYTFTVKAHNIAGSGTASTASGSVTPTIVLDVNYLVVAGAGGASGGGGGAGGLRSTVTATGRGGTLETAPTLTPSTNYTVTVGAGGTFGSNSGSNGANGSNSVFSTITSLGGGYGAGGGNTSRIVGGTGGCGGGAWLWNNGTATGRGAGTTSQGYDGGEINPGIAGNAAGGGGGGAGAQGGDATGGVDGGFLTGNQLRAAGVAVAITGSSVTYSAGGRGYHSSGALTHNAGSANTGRGGDGPAAGGASQNGFAGGSGVVILSYPDVFTITIGAGLTGTTATNGAYKVTTLTAGTGNVSWA